jgi:signal transduction histidine kinase/ligand-binding sensor domain-containing protein
MRRVAILLGFLMAGCGCGFALNPALDISQYAHTAWTVRDGFSVGAIFAMAQTPDGYLWLGSEFGLFRFDGVRSIPWQPPAGQHLPDKPYALLVTRDGTLWIGTFRGLVSWNGHKLTQYPELDDLFVTSLLEDRQGTVWAGILGGPRGNPIGRLCAIRSGTAQCYLENGAFGTFVWSLGEDSSGTLWAGAESGLWRWKPAPPKRYATPGARVGDMTNAGDGQLIFGISGAGLKRLISDELEPYPIQSATNRSALLADRDINSNKLLRDRDGGLWIGTHDRGLIHIHNGRTDTFRKTDGLSGDIACSLFEDHEGNVWFASPRGLDRFRELPVTTISARQGLSSDFTHSVLAPPNGSIWVATDDGLTRWKNNGEITVFRKANGLPDDVVQSLFEHNRGRIWASTHHGLAYFKDGRFVAANIALPSTEVFSITGDDARNLWLSGNRALLHIRDLRFVENFPWSALGRQQHANVVLFDRKRGGVWLAFWADGGVFYFKDGQIRASYTSAEGLGKGKVAGIQLDRDGALWAAIQDGGGLSRIKDGRITTLTISNGLPCDTIHWSIEADDRALWLYTACGLVRIAKSEVEAWIANPKHRVETTLWDATDGVALRSTSPAHYNPPAAISTDGRLCFQADEGIEVVDPHHLFTVNKIPPPVHIEQIVADHKIRWRNLPDAAVSNLRLPARTRDLTIGYTALSLVAPEKVHFKFKLEGQDQDWREVVNDRQVQYSNLSPHQYRFRIIACNNSGVWNEAGDSLEFSIDPAYYQTNWFRTLCAAVFLALLWLAYQFRVRQLQEKFNFASEARLNERMRIARELHDNLLQTVQGLMLSLQAVSEIMPAGTAKNKFEKTLEIGDRAIREGRSAVQDLRSASTTSDLTQAVRALGDELASGDGATFRLVVEGRMRELHPIVREEIYCIAREALRNAFTHARAIRIEAEIGFNDRLLQLRIRDDGKGITPDTTEQGSAGHYGLAGMRERARQIGSKLVILSGPETGTEVELSVPGSVAYAKQQGRFRFALFRRNGRAGL